MRNIIARLKKRFWKRKAERKFNRQALAEAVAEFAERMNNDPVFAAEQLQRERQIRYLAAVRWKEICDAAAAERNRHRCPCCVRYKG